MQIKNIRNIAIIAHVDHGKTTLVNQLLNASKTSDQHTTIVDRAMDKDPIEKERGITIMAKPTAIEYGDYLVNILDTPGHADFGGEVERIMQMVDGCLLLVDAFEGVMPQTRFVLKKALDAHVRPIVVVNKTDRSNAEPQKVVDEILELMIELNAPEDILDFKVVYTSALNGTSSYDSDPQSQTPGMIPVLETIIKELPAPHVSLEGPFLFQPTLLDYNEYVGRIGIGRIEQGSVSINDFVYILGPNGQSKSFRIRQLFGYVGLDRVDIERAEAGQIIGLAGTDDLNVGDTISSSIHASLLPHIKIDEPTIQMTFGVNTSPFAGKDGDLLTARKIEERLFREVQKDVSLRFQRLDNRETFLVSGRGELHLSILIENMRREGFEIEVSRPEVILKEINGEIYEPFEDVQIHVPQEYLGSIIDSFNSRGGEMLDMKTSDNAASLHYIIPTRGLIGFATNFMTLTKGYGVMYHRYLEYKKQVKSTGASRNIGVLVSSNNGKSTTYAIGHVEERGTLFIYPNEEVYEGMIVGENRYNRDLSVNVTQAKALTNIRASSKDHTVVLKIPLKMSLEECLDYINEDELLEITPHHFRLRKKVLNTGQREKIAAQKKLAKQN